MSCYKCGSTETIEIYSSKYMMESIMACPDHILEGAAKAQRIVEWQMTRNDHADKLREEHAAAHEAWLKENPEPT